MENPLKRLLPVRKPTDTEIITGLEAVLKDPNNKSLKMKLADMARRDPARVFTSIMRYQFSQYKKEIADYQLAVSEARDIYNPRRVLLTNLYQDIELDPFIYGIVTYKRILKITNKPFKIIGPDGKERDKETLLLKKAWFHDFMKMAMQSIFHGYSLTYFYDWENGEIKTTKLVYRDHVVPEQSAWVVMPYDLKGNDFTKPPYNQYMIGVGKPDDIGLYERAAIMYILRKHSWANWDEFEEIFGIPIRVAKTASTDKKVLDLVESWMQEMGSAGYGVFPADTEIDIKENKQTDAFNVFYRKIQACREELEILFTGQIRVSRENGTYNKDVSEREEADEITQDDKMFITNVVNDQLLPLLRANGYQIADDSRFDFNDGKKLTPKERLEIFAGVKQLGYTLDSKQVSEELDVTITGDVPPPPAPEPPAPIDKGKIRNQFERHIRMHADLLDLYKGNHDSV